MLYTLRDMSGLIARCEQRAEEPIFNQLKGLAGRNILSSLSNQYGKKGALLFSREEVFRARMLLAALDRGFASEKLAKFDAQMRFEPVALDVITGRQLSPCMRAAIADLTAELPTMWVFEVGLVRIDGELGFSGYWIADGAPVGETPDWSEFRHGFEGVTSFPFTNMCASLHGAMKAEG